MYQIKMQNDSCELLLYDLVMQGYTANRMIEQLKSAGNVNDITLRINSNGGEVFEALAIYNYLKSLNANISVYIDGIAASAASVIACAGRVIMPENAMMMLHNPWGFAQGDSEELRVLADILDKIRDGIVSVYQAKTGKERDTLAGIMQAETWLSAREAKELGLCDEIVAVAPAEPEQSEPAEPEDAAVNDEALAQVMLLDAVKAERTRLQELDALMTPERRGIIMKAKYETLQSASDIALELLKLQSRSDDAKELDGINALSIEPAKDEINSMAEIINRKRGYSHGRI